MPAELRIQRPAANARAQREPAGRQWYRIVNKADEEADVYIYDEIGYWGTTAADFVRDLGAIKAGKINLHLNTPGGDVFDGIAIHNALRQHPAAVHVQVDALAASIGSVIAMAGDTITMAKHSTMMIHDPYGMAIGNAEDMRKMSDVLDQLGDTIAGVYAERAGGSVREWRDRMLSETWYTDRAAVDTGLADQVDGDPDPNAQDSFDLSIFRHPPADLWPANVRTQTGKDGDDAGCEPTKRDIERALREAGLSRTQAKAFIAAAWANPGHDQTARDAAELGALQEALKVLK